MLPICHDSFCQLLSYLELIDLLRCRQVCKTWRRCVDDGRPVERIKQISALLAHRLPFLAGAKLGATVRRLDMIETKTGKVITYANAIAFSVKLGHQEVETIFPQGNDFVFLSNCQNMIQAFPDRELKTVSFQGTLMTDWKKLTTFLDEAGRGKKLNWLPRVLCLQHIRVVGKAPWELEESVRFLNRRLAAEAATTMEIGLSVLNNLLASQASAAGI